MGSSSTLLTDECYQVNTRRNLISLHITFRVLVFVTSLVCLEVVSMFTYIFEHALKQATVLFLFLHFFFSGGLIIHVRFYAFSEEEFVENVVFVFVLYFFRFSIFHMNFLINLADDKLFESDLFRFVGATRLFIIQTSTGKELLDDLHGTETNHLLQHVLFVVLM